jgi:purine-cytosine permease-like protein
MEYNFFYISIAIVIILFLVSVRIKGLALPSVIIGITTVGYSLINDILFGDYLKLFYYINTKELPLYAILAAIFLYPLLNIIYTLFLPKHIKAVLIYTFFWIISLIIFEYCSLLTKTIVFTGWKPVPWSGVTYIVAYLWIYFFYRYLSKRFNK